jgi:general secretion pathway protein C
MKNALLLNAKQRQILLQLASPKGRQLITSACVLFTVYVVAKTSWSLLPIELPLPTQLPSADVVQKSEVKRGVDLDSVASATWFGQASSDALASAQATIQPALSVAEAEAVESSLRINLLGVILADDPKLSRVIVDQQGSHQQFAIGETLPVGRNVALAKVLSDRIIVDNAGRYEFIALYESDQKALGRVAATPEVVAADESEPDDIFIDLSNDSEVSGMLAEVKQKVLSDPSSLAQLVNIGPQYEGGELIGYALSPGQMRKEFNQLGLKAGDILVSVNGMPLNTPEALPQVMVAMQSGMVDLELLRDGGSVNISVSMDAP